MQFSDLDGPAHPRRLLMTAAIAVTVVLALRHWPDVVLEIETSLIVLFAAFWAFQTAELWEPWLRGRRA